MQRLSLVSFVFQCRSLTSLKNWNPRVTETILLEPASLGATGEGGYRWCRYAVGSDKAFYEDHHKNARTYFHATRDTTIFLHVEPR